MRRKTESGASYRSPLKFGKQVEKDYKYLTTYAQLAGEPANRITGIDEAIGKLENLEMLFIANAQIEKLPKSIGQLSKLSDLELFNLPLTDLDASIFEGLTELVSVNISGLYKMSPDAILKVLEQMCLNCTKVQLLYINENKLTTLPENLYRMSDLRLLDAAFNKMTSVPSIQPIAPVQLILDFNKISELPADFCEVDDMELFTCVANNLQQFPAFLSNMEGGYAIEEIDLTTNKMHGFQEGFKGIRVERLTMAMNEMGKREGDKGVGEFPREFADTKSEINYLVLANNNIDTIRNAALKNFHSLQALDCAGNNLKDLPNGFNTTNLPNLSGVEFSYNEFREFPENVLNVARMSQLLMSSQGYYRDEAQTKWVRSMTKWPAYLHEHTGLVVVNLSGNDFRSVTNFPSNLNSLDVSNNPNIKMTVPARVIYRIQNGLFGFTYDEEQDITFAN
jgi:Leucine-rich repeat (LRR) protein